MSSKPYQLTSGEVHCWRVSLDVSPETFARLYSTLSREERNRSVRFRFGHSRRRFVVTHGVLRELLALYLQIRPSRIRYVYNGYGKPDLGPEFGNRLKFNLSHSAGLALIAIAPDSNLGVDLEYVRTQPEFLEIARRFFPPAEVDYLKRLPGHLRAQAFFSCWTRMEACVKATGGGLTNLDGTSIEIDSARCSSLYPLHPAPGYVGALAVEGSGWQLAQWHWQMVDDANLYDAICPLSSFRIMGYP